MKFNYKLVILSICLTALSHFAKSESGNENSLTVADSLFNNQKYTESFEIYDSLLDNAKTSSPAMLLKMAFIKEGLGDYSNAEYYLNLYYLNTSDRKVLDKMEELANSNSLKGYEFNDMEYIKTVFLKYFDYITYLLLALAILLLVIAYRQKFKLDNLSVAPGLLLVLVLGILFYTLNFGRNYDKAIIEDNNTYLMSGPSAGAEVLEIIDKGHRVNVRDSKDVWVRIEWDSQEAYVKADKIKQINFL